MGAFIDPKTRKLVVKFYGSLMRRWKAGERIKFSHEMRTQALRLSISPASAWRIVTESGMERLKK